MIILIYCIGVMMMKKKIIAFCGRLRYEGHLISADDGIYIIHDDKSNRKIILPISKTVIEEKE